MIRPWRPSFVAGRHFVFQALAWARARLAPKYPPPFPAHARLDRDLGRTGEHIEGEGGDIIIFPPKQRRLTLCMATAKSVLVVYQEPRAMPNRVVYRYDDDCYVEGQVIYGRGDSFHALPKTKRSLNWLFDPRYATAWRSEVLPFTPGKMKL